MRTEVQDATKACYTLAVHLFSQLVPGEQVTINSRMKGIEELPSCPCKCGRKIDIGNTGIGKINSRFSLLMGIYMGH